MKEGRQQLLELLDQLISVGKDVRRQKAIPLELLAKGEINETVRQTSQL